MDPVAFQWGALTVTWYGIFLSSGFLAGYLNWISLGRAEGRDANFCSDLLFWVMISGILGARTAYVLSDIPYFLAHPMDIVMIQKGGLVFYGGFVGTAAGLLVFARRRRQDLAGLLDFVVTSLPLGHVFGRIGCFINGCCHGRVHDGLCSVTYTRNTLPWLHQVYAEQINRFEMESHPVYPVQLYESLFNLVLFLVLRSVYVWQRKRGTGLFVTPVYLCLYPVGRFTLEYLRGDDRPYWLGLSFSQWVSLVLLGIGLVMAARAFYRAKTPVHSKAG